MRARAELRENAWCLCRTMITVYDWNLEWEVGNNLIKTDKARKHQTVFRSLDLILRTLECY